MWLSQGPSAAHCPSLLQGLRDPCRGSDQRRGTLSRDSLLLLYGSGRAGGRDAAWCSVLIRQGQGLCSALTCPVLSSQEAPKGRDMKAFEDRSTPLV